MPTIDEINHLYATNLGGATPTQADYNFWTNSGLSGDQLYNSFVGVAQNDPRYGSAGTVGSTAGTPANTGGLGGGGSKPTASPTVDMSGVTSAITGLGGTITGGFDTTNNNINTGFQNTNQNINNLGQNIAGGLTQTNTNMATGFNSLNKADEDRAKALGQQSTDNFNQLKGWTSGLGGQLTDLKGQMGTGFTGVSDQVKGVQTGVDTVKGGLTGLQDDFTTRSNIADQKRAEILDSVAGTAANNRQAMTQGFNQVGQQISGLGGATPQAAPQQGGQQGGGNMMQALNNAKGMLNNPQNLNPALGSQLTEFVSAFDQNGQLIQQGPDGQGVMTYRSIGPDGNLQIAKQQGQGIQFVGTLNIQQMSRMFGGGQ